MKNGEVKLIAVFEGAVNELYGEKAIVLKDIMTLDGVYVQHYLLLKNFEDFVCLQDLNHGEKVLFTGNVYAGSNFGVLLPRDFILAN
jgi:hypothetical protein